MTRLIRTLTDLRGALVSSAAIMLLVIAGVLAFVHPQRPDLYGNFLTAGCALLASPERHGRATDPENRP